LTRSHSFHDQQTLTVADEEYRTVTEGRIRIRIGVVAFIFMLLITIARLAEISLFSSDVHQRNLPQAISIERADLTDRQGELLATTLETYSLYAEPRRVWNPRSESIRAKISHLILLGLQMSTWSALRAQSVRSILI